MVKFEAKFGLGDKVQVYMSPTDKANKGSVSAVIFRADGISYELDDEGVQHDAYWVTPDGIEWKSP